MHVDELERSNNAIVQISGDITIIVDSEFELENSVKIKILPGATLTMYVKGNIELDNGIEFNVNSADP